MEEKIYKTMSSTGAANLAIGICVLVGGIVSGILLIVNGARLLKHKGKIMFNGIFPKGEKVPFKGTLSLLFSCNKSAYFTEFLNHTGMFLCLHIIINPDKQ